MSADGSVLISHAGALLLLETLRVTGLDQALSEQLQRWRPTRAIHDPGKIIADLAVSLALGGDCLADIAILRSQPQLFGPIASDPTVSRLIDRLATDTTKALKAIRRARAIAREHARTRAGSAAPGADGRLIPIDLDATIVISHSDKENATPTWKKTFGFHPMTAFADHGTDGAGEPLALVLRAGNAGFNTATDHIDATTLALAQLPATRRRQTLIRTDSGGGTHEFLTWLTRPGRWLKYSIGFTITDDIGAAISRLPAGAWTPAYDAERQVRPGAWVAEITGLANLTSWPKGMRVIVRRERPHPGARLRFTDPDGHRFTCFVTNTKQGQLADPPAAGSPSACACSPSPGAWSAAAEDSGSASPPDGPGPPRSSLPSPACKPCPHHPDQRQTAPPIRKGHPRARGTPLTQRDSRATTLTRKRNHASAKF
jgi:hypothetical protein